MTKIFFLLLTLFHGCLVVRGKVQAGSFYQKGWKFLDRFCYGESEGQLKFEYVLDPSSRPGQDIAFYADTLEQWHAVYKAKNMSCHERLSKAAKVLRLGEIKSIALQVYGNRPRWWYITLSNCENNDISLANFKLTQTNIGGFYLHQVSKDEQGILEMVQFFLILDVLFLCLLLYSKYRCKRLNLQYNVHKILAFSVGMNTIGLFFNFGDRFNFCKNGIGLPALQILVFYFDTLSTLSMLYVIMAIGQGLYISTNYIRTRLLYCLLYLYLALSILFWTWSYFIYDPASDLYLYDSSPGFVCIFSRIALMIWFLTSIRQTFLAETDTRKRKFYFAFCCWGVLWFLSLPLLFLLARRVPSWQRAKLLFGVEATWVHLLYVTLWLLFRPTVRNKHVLVLDPNRSRAFSNNSQQIFPVNILESATTDVPRPPVAIAMTPLDQMDSI